MKPIDPRRLDKIIIGQDTHEGETGKNNEDSGGFFAFQISEQNDTEVYLGVVADGIGGHQAGERASRLGIAVIERHFRQVTSSLLRSHFKESFEMANAQIVQEGRSNSKFRGMGTTMTAAAIMKGRLYIANLGDSRAYLIRDGVIRQLSVDHTWAQEAIEAGRLTAAEARQHPNRNVIKRYMGIQSAIEVDFRMAHLEDPTKAPSEEYQGSPVKGGDLILLCSDGLSDMISDEEILAEVLKNSPQEAAEQLVLRAREAGGFDNITVVLMQVPGKKKKAAAAAPGKKRGMATVGILLLLAFVIVAAVLALTVGRDLLGGDATATLAPQATVPPTMTPALTDTPVPSPSPTSTVQEIVPTGAPSATATEALVPTETPTAAATPTGVPTFTPTNTPRPTNTPLPPTATPTLTPTTEAAPPPPKPKKTKPPEPPPPTPEPIGG